MLQSGSRLLKLGDIEVYISAFHRISCSESACLYHSVPWFCVYQAWVVQIHCSTSPRVYITMKKLCVVSFLLTFVTVSE
jgi:hypothetical protein